jgi:hypothetical protein
MSVLLENETVFIVRRRALVRELIREVVEARIVPPRRRGLSAPYFSWVSIDDGRGERFFSDEGVTWARPENKSALDVVVALT